MSEDQIAPIQGVGSTASKIKAQQLAAQQQFREYVVSQVESQEDFTEWSELSAFNPLAMRKQFEKLEKRAAKTEKEEQAEKKEEGKQVTQAEKNQARAKAFEKRNPELHSRTLLLIKAQIKESDTLEQILGKIAKSYPDKYLSDEALDYLLDTTDPSSELGKKLKTAKKQFNEKFGREVRAGRNISEHARSFSKQGLGNPNALRDLYRDITGNPRPPAQLFEELNTTFTYADMKKAIDFILHSLGSDLKSKGPSISPAELQRLFSEARTLQAILGIYRFFRGRLGIMMKQFKKEDLTFPQRLTFELLAKQFVRFIQERYPTTDRILQLALILGISEELAAQIIVFTQYRDAMRQVSPRLFQSDRHRQDLLMALIESLSDIEDMMEDAEEEEEEDEEENEDKPRPYRPKDTIE